LSKILIPSHTYIDNNQYINLSNLINLWKSKKILIITDKNIRKAGLLKPLETLFSQLECSYTIIDDSPAEPSADDVDQINYQVNSVECDSIIGIGGGSILDITKLIGTMYHSKYKVRELIEDSSLITKKVKTIGIPTTCGTGSEATINSIVSLPEKGTKLGIVNTSFLMDAVILNPETLINLPKSLVASTGIDALTHTVECYTGNKANILSDFYALEGAKLIFENLEKAYLDGSNILAKQNLLLGSFFGGIAINSSGTTAVHALSYPLGGSFHIPHGVSNAIMFVPIMKFNRDSIEDRLTSLFDYVFKNINLSTENEKSQFVIDKIEDLVKVTNIPSKLDQYGVTIDDLEFLVDAGSKQKRLLDNNRKPLTLDDIESIYRSLL
jgi:alcohol dehydrogenase class IV